MAANFTFKTIGDIAAADWELAIRCDCGHVGVIDADKTVRWFHCHRWDTQKFRALRHFRCSRCGRRRAVKLGISANLPRDFGIYPTTEEGWARIVKRLRG
ncbi:hypothetical protein [Sphingomonas sp. S2-65]|uniref:hypothetical protein n=1 Tax=Sphingomonas sp. S2-65 TaxID=2903960 RepID=UPI001F1FCD23|nr:hypothetical protein [Sphingomonas sp. S2-65]UYY60085.1 hypothetical protein LZ586_08415 [Sphingomonas sp. S2-65]